MAFNSINYIVFLGIIVILYYTFQNSILKKIVLLLGNYFFYLQFGYRYALILLGLTVFSYFMGRIIEKKERSRKFGIVLSVGLCLLVLFVFKYLDFTLDTLDKITNMFGRQTRFVFEVEILAPIGLSFYIFQTISYLVDIYAQKIKVEKNFVDYALYISFFATITSGPIERAKHFLPQLKTQNTFNWKNVEEGISLFLFGLFKKIVIADRIAIYVDTVYNNVSNYAGMPVFIATILFSLQLYCDFSSYSEMAIGSAKILGFDLVENFNIPYFSASIKEFWRRWHISLSTWFRDYLYIPLGGNRKGRIRTKLNCLITFTISGLWHGANWTYIVWGMLHGLYQIIESIWQGDGERKGFPKWLRVIMTFAATNFAWIFFRAESIRSAFDIIRLSCVGWDMSCWGQQYEMLLKSGIDKYFILVVIVSLAILLVNDLFVYYKGYYWFSKCNSMALTTVHYLLMLFIIFVFGVYGPMFGASSFIYFQF